MKGSEINFDFWLIYMKGSEIKNDLYRSNILSLVKLNNETIVKQYLALTKIRELN